MLQTEAYLIICDSKSFIVQATGKFKRHKICSYEILNCSFDKLPFFHFVPSKGLVLNQIGKPEAVFLVMCDPSMNKL